MKPCFDKCNLKKLPILDYHSFGEVLLQLFDNQLINPSCDLTRQCNLLPTHTIKNIYKKNTLDRLWNVLEKMLHYHM